MRMAQEMANSGEQRIAVLRNAMLAELHGETAAGVDYLDIVDRRSLEPIERLHEEARIIGAIRFERVRLIDNLSICPAKLLSAPP
jgi:pantothenate synthetase